MTDNILFVLGRSGSGKDSIVREATILANRHTTDNNVEVVVSYTTRPKRISEKDGIEHIFIDEEFCSKLGKDDMFAYTEIGEYKYFTTKQQIKSMLENDKLPVYIIDPNGLKNTHQILKDIGIKHIYIAYVSADREIRQSRFIARGGTSTEFEIRDSSETDQFDKFESNVDDDTHIVIVNNNYNSKILLEANIRYLKGIMLALVKDKYYLKIPTDIC